MKSGYGRYEVATARNAVYVRAHGLASMNNCLALRDFLDQVMTLGQTLVIMDLAYCTGMDSTFMGVLAGMATRLARQTGGKMLMLNVPDKLFEILSTLGLDQLMECRRLGAVPEPLVEPPLTARALSPIAVAAAALA